MRTIKFRAWHKEDKKMLNGTRATSIPMFTPNFMFRNHEVELMQFTGLLDKNGKEIYENDVISYMQHHFNMESVTAKMKQVKWNKDRWNVFETNAGESNIEVIGNIHENPELLK